jgi:hypothetical protein
MGSYVPILADQGRLVAQDVMDVGPMRLFPGAWLDGMLNWVYPRIRAQTAPFNRVAKRLGIEPVRGLYDLVLGDLTLVTDVPGILGISEAELLAWRPNPKHRLRPSLRLAYAGAIYATLPGEVPPKVERALAGEGKKVYVALTSTTQAHVEGAYASLAEQDATVVMATTPEIDRARLTGAPNILVEGLLPSHLVMPRCDVAIIHGGQGSVQTAIASGTPIVGVPLQPEQGFNLRLVQQHGAGRCLSLRALAKGKLGPTVDGILGDTTFAAAMKELQRAQASRDGPLEAARATCELARSWRDQGGSPA